MDISLVAKPQMKDIFFSLHEIKCKSYSLQKFEFSFYYIPREANLTFCCVIFDSQLCPFAVKYKIFYSSLVKI